MSCYECKHNNNGRVCELFDDLIPRDYTCIWENSRLEETEHAN